jgi:DNA-binding NarL/FixJ family response regulator
MIRPSGMMSRKRLRGTQSNRREDVGQPVASGADRIGKVIRLAVAALPALFCEALAYRLERETDLEVVGCPTRETEITQLLKAKRPHVLLFDYEGLGPNAERVIARLRQATPCTRVLVLATRSSQETIERVLRVGASGVVDKQLDFATLLRAIRALASGELWANRRATAEFVEHLAESIAREADSDGRLTEREWEIAEGVGKGLRNKEIAHKLRISEKTVKSHLNNIFRKLHVDNRFAAGMYVLSRHQT